MKRRDFLKYSAPLAALPLILKGQPLFAVGKDLFLEMLTAMNPLRKLVLVQLNGGSDGLNTIVPLDQYANLYKARPNIIIPEKKLLSLTDTVGLHPSYDKIRQMYVEEEILFVQSVGYPNPNYSHFRSKDILVSASDSDVVLRSGWLGRMMDRQHPGYPEGYPSEENPHPVALTIGSTSSATCQGETSNLSSVITNLSSSYLSGIGEEVFPDSPYGNEMKFITSVMRQTEVYLEAVSEAASKADNLSTKYPAAGENKLADQLKIVANLMAGGLQTQIYVVNLGGFDTHSYQVSSTDPETGKHADLLSDVAEALYAFQDDLKLLGIADDVLGFVFSEFGRRIKSNDSYGTDHGAAWPGILFGSSVNPVVLGSNPVIPDEVTKNDNLPMQFDFRSVYASIFKYWFEADDELISDVLMKDFEYLPILKSADTTQVSEQNGGPAIEGVFPNPVSSQSSIRFQSWGGRISLKIYSSDGKLTRNLVDGTLPAGMHETSLNSDGLLPGNYYLVLENSFHRNSRIITIL